MKTRYVDVEPYAVNRLCLSMRNVRDYDPPKDYHRVATVTSDGSLTLKRRNVLHTLNYTNHKTTASKVALVRNLVRAH